MSFVVDASIAGSWFLPDEATEATTGLARRVGAEGANAPDLFWHEVRNLLVNARRRRRLDQADLESHLNWLEALPLLNVGRGDGRLVARLAQQHGLTAYDSAYLAAAVTTRLPLASLDKALRTAAKAEGVALLPEAE